MVDAEVIDTREEKALIKLSANPKKTQIAIDRAKKKRLKFDVDIVKTIEFSRKGIPLKDIASFQGLNPENPRVILYLKALIKSYSPKIDQKDVAVFKNFRGELMAAKQKEVLDALTPQKLALAEVKDLAFLFDKLFINERLEEEKSTVNIAGKFSSLVEDIHRGRDE